MSSIAYISDSGLLDSHRLNENKKINFWRISSKTGFSDFVKGDLVFFLSKDKAHLSPKKEKGIVGFGRLLSVNIGSIEGMWKKYETLNGYSSLEKFKEAILKASKSEELPERISSFYLENVTFFQTPVYLSECGQIISKNVESYVYLEDEVVLKLLEHGRTNFDLWSSDQDREEKIREEQLGVALSIVHKNMGGDKLSANRRSKIKRYMDGVIETHSTFRFIKSSVCEIYHSYDQYVTIIFYKDKNTDLRTLIGEAALYRKNLPKYYPYPLSIVFRTIDNDSEFDEIVN